MRSKLNKITFLLPGSGAGGGVRAIKDFGNGLIRLGYDVRIIFKQNTDLNLLKKYYRKLFYSDLNWLDFFMGSVHSYEERLDELSFDENEIVISMCSRTTLDANNLRFPKVFKIMHCHGAEYENWGNFIQAINLPFPKIAVSQHVKNIIEKYSLQKVFAVVPNGIHHNEYFREPNTNKDGVGGCIRFRYSKDQFCTEKVFEILQKQNPTIQLYSFGIGKRPKASSFIDYTDNPSIPVARAIYNKCKVWFLASIEEGFGLPVLEAMACGCVVVSTQCGGPADLIRDGYNGYFVEVGNYGGIVSKITEVLEDQALLDEMSKNAIKTSKKYSWELSSKMLIESIRQIPEINRALTK